MPREGSDAEVVDGELDLECCHDFLPTNSPQEPPKPFVSKILSERHPNNAPNHVTGFSMAGEGKPFLQNEKAVV
jgi:hypothetical protein